MGIRSKRPGNVEVQWLVQHEHAGTLMPNRCIDKLLSVGTVNVGLEYEEGIRYLNKLEGGLTRQH